MDLESEVFEKVVEKYNYADDTIIAIRLVLYEGWRVIDAAKEVGKTRLSLSNSLSSFKRRMNSIDKEIERLKIQTEWENLSERARHDRIMALIESWR